MGTNEKITVCHIISGDLWAGAEVQMFTLVASLNKAPEIKILSIVLNDGTLAKKLRDTGMETIVIEESRNSSLKILSRLKELLKSKNVDILHTHRYKENILGALLKKKGLVKKLIQTVHGLDEPFAGIGLLKAKLYNYLNYYYTNKYFDKVIAVSNDIKNRLSGSIHPSKLITIHNAVNQANLVAKKSSSEIRRELGCQNAELIIGSAGRMVPIKGYDVFLKAAKIILEKRQDVSFLLIGDGPLKPKLETMAKRLGIENRVIFPGFRSDIVDIIKSMDIFVLSSLSEGIPIVLLEAMALKKAVVITNVGGMPEVIEDRVSGILINSSDADQLAAACLDIISNPGVKQKMELEAAQRIKKLFSIEGLTSKILDLYREEWNPQ